MAKMIQKTTAFERFVHLLLALSGLTLLLTGLGFLYQQELGWLNTIFGGVHIAKEIHNWGGDCLYCLPGPFSRHMGPGMSQVVRR